MSEKAFGGEGEKPTIRQRLVGTLRSLVGKGRIDRPVSTQTVAQEDIKNHYLINEPISTQFPLTDFRYYRDASVRLGLGNHYDPEIDTSVPLILPGENERSSHSLGSAASNIFLDTIRGLREGRVNEQGQQYVLCEDEVSDTQVIAQATVSEREKFARLAISGLIRRHFFQNSKAEFAAGAIFAVSVMTGNEITQASKIVRQAIAEADTTQIIKDAFNSALDNFSHTRVEELLSFIKGIKARIINEETQYRFKHGPAKHGSFEEAYEASAKTGEPILSIEGQDYAAKPAGELHREPYRLDAREARMIVPLREAVHHSRAEMIKQARLLAVKYLGLKPESMNYSPTPPQWWVSGEGGKELRSDELLVYIPHPENEPERANYPAFLQGFDEHWYLIRMPFDADGNVRMTFATSLHS